MNVIVRFLNRTNEYIEFSRKLYVDDVGSYEYRYYINDDDESNDEYIAESLNISLENYYRLAQEFDNEHTTGDMFFANEFECVKFLEKLRKFVFNNSEEY
jgi:hypothetical protein